MKFGLTNSVLNKVGNVFLEYSDIEEVVIYGSRAKGDFLNGSDIDLTLKGKNITMDHLFKIDTQLDDLILPYNFDLSIYHQISDTDLIEHIDRVGIMFYQKVSGIRVQAKSN
ncbi:MAG: putative nucleotidyltransferase [Cyclobacteriaceae bacterium]|jgi:predicted nucleotidyltransferase